MPKLVNISGVGVVQFPDEATEDQILDALHQDYPSEERKSLMQQMEEVRAEKPPTLLEAAALREYEPYANRQIATEAGKQLTRLVTSILSPSEQEAQKPDLGMRLVGLESKDLVKQKNIAKENLQKAVAGGMMKGAEVPKLSIPEDAGFAEAFSRTMVNAGLSLPEFFTSPAGVLTAAGGVVAKIPTAAFWTTKLGIDAIKQAKDTYHSWDEMTSGQKGEALAGIIANTGMAALGAKHTAQMGKQAIAAGVTGPIAATARAIIQRPLPTRAQRAGLTGIQTPLPPAMEPAGIQAQPGPVHPGGVVSPIFGSVVDSGLNQATVNAASVGLGLSARMAAKSPRGLTGETAVQPQPAETAATAGQGGLGVTGSAVAPMPSIKTTTSLSELSQQAGGENAIPIRETAAVPVEVPPENRQALGAQVREQAPSEGKTQAEPTETQVESGPYIPDWRGETGWKAKPITIAEASKLLREEGIKGEDVDALLSGKATIKEVITRNLNDFNPPDFGPATPTEVGGQGHAAAWMEAWNQAYRRVSYVMDNLVDNKPSSAAAPGPPTQTPKAATAAIATQTQAAAAAQPPTAAPPPRSTTLPGTGTQGAAPAPQPTQGPAPFTPGALMTPQAKRVGIIAGQPLPQLPTIFQKVGSWLKKNFKAIGLRPESLFTREQMMGFERNKYDAQRERLSVDFKRAVRKAYGISAIGEAAGGLRRIPEQDVRLLSDYLKGDVYNAASIPIEIRGVLDNMRSVVDGLSTELANLLRARAQSLPARQAAQARALMAFADSILQNRNHYLHRSYKFFDSDLNSVDWYNQMPEQVRLAAEAYKQHNTGTGAPLTPFEAQSLLTQWLEDLKPSIGQIKSGTSKLGAKDMSILASRQPIPEPLRALLGEYHDPLINFSKTASKLAQHVAAQKFLNDVRAAGLREGWLFEGNKAPPGFQVEIAGPGSDPMNPLSGMRTSPEIAEVFVEVGKQVSDGTWAAGFWNAYLKLNAVTKFAATAQSLMTQQRNLLGQPFMWGMSGHWSADAIKTALTAMREEVMKGGNQGARTYLDSAYEVGVLGDTARFRELMNVLEDADFQTVGPEMLKDWSPGRLLKKYGITGAAKLYKFSDEFGKLVGWEAEKSNVRKVFPTWTDKQIAVESGRRIRDWYMTYSMVPKAIQSLRKLPFGPFVSFSYEAVRTSINAIHQSITELRSSNPVERNIGAKRLASQLLTLATPTALSALTAWKFGVSGQEEEDFRLFQPFYNKNSQFAWLPSKEGERNSINLSYLNPYQYTDVLQSVISDVRTGKDPTELLIRGLGEMLRPYYSEQLLAKVLIDSFRNKTPTGAKIYEEQDTWQEKVRKLSEHLTMPLLPGTVQRALKRTIPSFYQAQPKYGRKLNPAREVARELTGISLDGFDYRVGLGYAAGDYSEGMKSAENVFRYPITSTQPMSDSDMLKSYIAADEARQKVWTDLRLKYLAALRRGVPIQDAVNALTDNGVRGIDQRSIVSGVYIPYNVTKTVFQRAWDAKKRIPMALIDKYRSKVTGQKEVGLPR